MKNICTRVEKPQGAGYVGGLGVDTWADWLKVGSSA